LPVRGLRRSEEGINKKEEKQNKRFKEKEENKVKMISRSSLAARFLGISSKAFSTVKGNLVSFQHPFLFLITRRVKNLKYCH